MLTGCGLFVENVILKNNSCSYDQREKPIDSWRNSEKTFEEHMRQWIMCGGNSHGDYEPKTEQLKYTCMLDAGYQYISECSDSDSNWICREKSLDKFPPYYERGHLLDFTFRD